MGSELGDAPAAGADAASFPFATFWVAELNPMSPSR